MGAHGGSPAQERALLEAARRDDGVAFGPVVVGEGTPAFEGRHAGVALRRIDVRGLDGSENVLVRYEVRPGNA